MKKRYFFLGALAASLVWIAVLSTPLFIPKAVSRTLFSFLDVSGPPSRADFIMVPSGSLFYRLPFAADLLHRNLGDTLILTVTEPSAWRKQARQWAGVGEVTEGSMVLRLLRTHNVSDTQVVFLGESRSTWQDARLFCDFLAAHPTATAMAVSDGYHLRRLRLSVSRTDPNAAQRVSYVSSSSFDDMLTRDTESSDSYQQIFKEWIKLIFYTLGRA